MSDVNRLLKGTGSINRKSENASCERPSNEPLTLRPRRTASSKRWCLLGSTSSGARLRRIGKRIHTPRSFSRLIPMKYFVWAACSIDSANVYGLYEEYCRASTIGRKMDFKQYMELVAMEEIYAYEQRRD